MPSHTLFFLLPVLRMVNGNAQSSVLGQPLARVKTISWDLMSYSAVLRNYLPAHHVTQTVNVLSGPCLKWAETNSTLAAHTAIEQSWVLSRGNNQREHPSEPHLAKSIKAQLPKPRKCTLDTCHVLTTRMRETGNLEQYDPDYRTLRPSFSSSPWLMSTRDGQDFNPTGLTQVKEKLLKHVAATHPLRPPVQLPWMQGSLRHSFTCE